VAHDPLPASLGAIDATGAAPLSDVLDACGDRMLVNVEIKNSKVDPDYDPTLAIVGDVLAELRRRGPAWTDRWLISSFSWTTVAACRDLAPEIATAALTSGPVDDAALGRLAAVGHRALHPWETQVDEALVARCRQHGLAVNTWTCNEPARLVALAAIGVDGVCTDVPDLALDALGRSGPAAQPAWPWRR
jgi:glycerophosphoryl diester phosphodiesterase